jgi:tRNA 2-thiouridine synthesizing protein E
MRVEPATDPEGHLRELSDWSPAIAEWLAAREGLTLTREHWDLIELVRGFYADCQVSPPMRVLVKLARERFGEARGTSIYLLRLFPGSPARLLAKIAGLPRPTNCL